MIEFNAALKNLNTFNIPAFAETFLRIADERELFESKIVEILASRRVVILGGGSNILLTKTTIPFVMSFQGKGMAITANTPSNTLIEAAAGEVWDDVVQFAVLNNLGGIENLSGIPGLAGAAPIQNIGAYGQEIADTLDYVRFYDFATGLMKTFNRAECESGYRDSIFKSKLKGKILITKIGLRLANNPLPNLSYKPLSDKFNNTSHSPSISEVRSAVIKIRESKLPNLSLLGNSGSFFKNPIISLEQFNELKKIYPAIPSFQFMDKVKIPAGWLIETAGWKGKRIGNVGCYEKQALVLVNYGGATGEEIVSFAETIRQSIVKKFDIVLDFEVNTI